MKAIEFHKRVSELNPELASRISSMPIFKAENAVGEHYGIDIIYQLEGSKKISSDKGDSSRKPLVVMDFREFMKAKFKPNKKKQVRRDGN